MCGRNGELIPHSTPLILLHGAFLPMEKQIILLKGTKTRPFLRLHCCARYGDGGADFLSRMRTSLETGVLLFFATLSMGMRTFVSGKYVAAQPAGIG